MKVHHYNITTLILLVYVCIGVAVIEGPVEVIYRPGDDPVELTCTIYEGAAGWSVNGENPVTATAIRNGGLDNHTVSGTNLVVLVPTNNTQYVCVAIRDGGDFYSNPVYLYIAGTYVLHSTLYSYDIIYIDTYHKSGNFHVKIIHVLNIHVDLFLWVFGTHENILI